MKKATFLIIVSSLLLIQWSNDPNVNSRISNASAWSREPVIVTDSNGYSIIAWEIRPVVLRFREYPFGIGGPSIYLSVGSPLIYAQRVNPEGAPTWAANGIPITGGSTDTVNENPKIISDGLGGAIIVWEVVSSSSGRDIYAQRVDGLGNLLWGSGGVVICNAANDQYNHELIPDGSGGAIIAWIDNRTSLGSGVATQRVDGNGNVMWKGNGVEIDSGSSVYASWLKVGLATDGAGGAIISWEADFSGNYSHLVAQRVNQNGSIMWDPRPDIHVNLINAPLYRSKPTIVPDGVGGALIFDQHMSVVAYKSIRAFRINANGASVWGVWNDGYFNWKLIRTYSKQDYKAIPDGNGGAYLAWLEVPTTLIHPPTPPPLNLDDVALHVQRINRNGDLLWDTPGVYITDTASLNEYEYGYTLAPDNAGGVIVTWSDDRNSSLDIYAQRVNASGEVWRAGGVPVCTALGTQFPYSMSSTSDGGAIAVWHGNLVFLAPEVGPFPSTRVLFYMFTDIYAQRICPDGTLGDCNLQPVAIIRWARSTTLLINFDGSCSYDPDGTVVEWQWDFGDGQTASGANVSHTYANLGEYTVQLRVRDNEGKWGYKEIIISVFPL